MNGLNNLRELRFDLDTSQIIHQRDLAGRHSYQDNTEMRAMEKACLDSPEVKDVIKLLELPDEASVKVECWTYGTDGMNDMSERIIMVCSSLP